jgi:hypothetical protein
MRVRRFCWFVGLLMFDPVVADQEVESEAKVESAMMLTVSISSAGPFEAERDTRRANFFLTNKGTSAIDVATRFATANVNFVEAEGSVIVHFVVGQQLVPDDGGRRKVKLPPADYGRVTLKPGEVVEVKGREVIDLDFSRRPLRTLKVYYSVLLEDEAPDLWVGNIKWFMDLKPDEDGVPALENGKYVGYFTLKPE